MVMEVDVETPQVSFQESDSIRGMDLITDLRGGSA